MEFIVKGKRFKLPVAVETAGPWCAEAKCFVSEIGRRLRDNGGDHCSGWYLIQRISIAIQRGNAASVMGTFEPGPIRVLLYLCMKYVTSEDDKKREGRSASHIPIHHTYSEHHNRVAVPVPQPIPFTVPRPVPYPVHVGVPVDHPRPVIVPVPHPVAHFIPRPIAVPIDRPFPYPVAHPVPVTITQGVGIPVPQPYHVAVPAPVPVRVPVAVGQVVSRPVVASGAVVASSAGVGVAQQVVSSAEVHSSGDSDYGTAVESHGHAIEHPY